MEMSLEDSSRIALLLCCSISIAVSLSGATTTDIHCLRKLKESLQDPLHYLSSSWAFENISEGSICKFVGIECWHPNENRVLNIRLYDMGLRGQFPHGLENCTTMTGLDLSNNNLHGPIPSDVSTIVKYLTLLDLSSNRLSGEIPVKLGNCSFLNTLKLDNNFFTGRIPPQLGLLDRLTSFSVTNNLLSGPIPQFRYPMKAGSFENNTGLCGAPLNECSGPEQKSRAAVIAGVAVGSGILTIAILALIFCYLSRGLALKKKDDDPKGNKWIVNIKGLKKLKVSMFEKSASKMKLSDLMTATNSFNKSNIIGSGRTGTVFKGTLPDGCCLMIKRLQASDSSEKAFVSEMNTLGSVKHRNLVPLLGYCVAKRERLLVYKHMANGTLHDRLHLNLNPMDWPQRLVIGIGAARGLAWLHHTCNPRIIHRNISSRCILLDDDSEPRLSDFGLARLMNPVDTHLSTFVNGEFGDLGYVAPEYARTLVATPKGDVYSFGTVLLELITGQIPTHVDGEFKGSLAEWVMDLSAKGVVQSAIDRSLVGKEDWDAELNQFLRVACNCVSVNPRERPTMFEVYELLRVIGARYQFKGDDEALLQTDPGDGGFADELIVAWETGT